MKKSCVILCLAGMLSVTAGAAALGAESDKADLYPVRVEIDGKQLESGGYIINNRTIVSARELFDNLGLHTEWNEASRTATAKNNEYEIIIPCDSDKITINSREIKLHVPQTIINDHMYILVKEIPQIMGAEVVWNGAERSVSVKSGNIVDLPESPDGMVDMVIDEVDWENKVMYFSYAENGCYQLDLSGADELHIYNHLYAAPKAKEIELENLREGDVLSIAYDTSVPFDESKTYSMYLSRNSVEDRLERIDNDYTYVMESIGSFECLCENEYDMNVESNVSYSFYLDIFNRIVNVGILGGSPYKYNFGVLQNITFENNIYYAEIVDENGTQKLPLNNELTAKRLRLFLYVNERVTDSDESYWYESETEDEENIGPVAQENISELSYRVIRYVQTKNGIITSGFNATRNYSYPNNEVRVSEEEYIKSEHKLGGLDITNSTIIDLRDFEKDGTYRLIDESQLKDHEHIIYSRFRSDRHIVIY